MGPSRALCLALALAVLAAAAPVAAQVLVEPGETAVPADAGAAVAWNVTASNPTERSYFLVAAVEGDFVAGATVEPRRALVGPGAEVPINVTVVVPGDARPGDRRVELVLSFVDRATGDVFEERAALAMRVGAAPAFLGIAQNVLPPPFDRGWGLFLAETGAWAVIATVILGAARAVLPRVVAVATPSLRQRMGRRIGTPLWVAVFVVGLGAAWRHAPPTPLVGALDGLTDVAAAVILAVFAYRVLSAALLYYSERVAAADRRESAAALAQVTEKVALVAVALFLLTYALRVLGVDLSFLLAGGLVVGLVLSFAAQDSLSNFFSGLFLLMDRPFREGDEILLESGERCRVDRIGLRTTRLFHFRHDQELIVPNNELATKQVVNMTYPDATHRLLLPLLVAYDTDLARARDLLLEVARSVPDVMSGPDRDPVVWARAFADSGIELQLRVYIPSPRHRNPVRTALVFGIKAAFDRAGIVIPAPQREVWLRTAPGREAFPRETPPRRADE